VGASQLIEATWTEDAPLGDLLIPSMLMQTVDWLWQIHPALAVVIVYPQKAGLDGWFKV